MKRVIAPVSSNVDKQKTYQMMLGKYRAATKQGFYYEALLIDYAMMEDRFRSLIFYMGGLRDRGSYKVDVNKFKKCIKPMLLPCAKKKTPNLGITSLEGKMYVVKCILEWAITTTKELQDEYLIVLKRELESLDVDGLLQTIDRIYEWKDYRNEVIHALMNKSMESLDYGIKDKVDEGMELARFVDGQVRIIKKKNKIREILNLE